MLMMAVLLVMMITIIGSLCDVSVIDLTSVSAMTS